MLVKLIKWEDRSTVEMAEDWYVRDELEKIVLPEFLFAEVIKYCHPKAATGKWDGRFFQITTWKHLEVFRSLQLPCCSISPPFKGFRKVDRTEATAHFL